MPRIFGVNIIAWLVATLALYFTGFVFYGLLFSQLWVGLWGFTDAQMQAAEAGTGLSMALGFVISLATALFLGIALKAFGANGMKDALTKAVLLWAGFAVTTLAYDTVYAMQPALLLVLDAAHLLVGFLAAAAVLTAMDGTGSKSAAA